MNNQYQNGMNVNTINNQNKNANSFKIILIIMLSVLALLMSLIVIFSLKESNVKTRTFMIYMVGSDLESRGSMGAYELEGIDPLQVDLKNNNVVLIAGGSKKWGNEYIDEDETSIYRLTESGFKKVKQQSIKNMGSSETLSSFINYATEHYITDEYELLFWNHGGAIMGSEFDELSNNDYLSLQEISEALTKTSFNKNNKIETVIFSTCLNGTIENANIFKDYAKYFVASEEISMSVKNQSDFSFINNVTPRNDSVDIGLMYIEKYKEKMAYLKSAYKVQNEEYNIYSTYSVVDLENIDNLKLSKNITANDLSLLPNVEFLELNNYNYENLDYSKNNSLIYLK